MPKGQQPSAGSSLSAGRVAVGEGAGGLVVPGNVARRPVQHGGHVVRHPVEQRGDIVRAGNGLRLWAPARRAQPRPEEPALESCCRLKIPNSSPNPMCCIGVEFNVVCLYNRMSAFSL